MNKNPDMSFKIRNKTFPGRVWAASGTFGNAEEFAGLVELRAIGAVVTKTITLEPREGNVPPRLVETAGGLVNSIGLANPGVDIFIKDIFPRLEELPVAKIVSVAGPTAGAIIKCAEQVLERTEPDGLELNLSCPNVEHSAKGRSFAQDKDLAGLIVREVRLFSDIPLIAKLSPQVTDIAAIAEEVVSAGCDAVSLINTFPALVIDPETMRPVLGNVTGGLSGPAIKVLALKAVFDVSQRVDKPIIGMGGITCGSDAAEFFLAGASCVQVGTVNFVDPAACERITKELSDYVAAKGFSSLGDLTGRLLI